MVHYLTINFLICEVMTMLAASADVTAKWKARVGQSRQVHPEIAHAIHRTRLGRLAGLYRRLPRPLQRALYQIARALIGFN